MFFGFPVKALLCSVSCVLKEAYGVYICRYRVDIASSDLTSYGSATFGWVIGRVRKSQLKENPMSTSVWATFTSYWRHFPEFDQIRVDLCFASAVARRVDLLKKGTDGFLQEDASDDWRFQRGVVPLQCFIPIASWLLSPRTVRLSALTQKE